MECFIYKGLRVFFGVRMVIFDDVKSGEMLDFSGFARSGCRTQNGDLGVETTDMLFSVIEHLF